MKKKFTKLNLFRFDGEGGGAEGGASAQTASSPAAEQEKIVVYGKDPKGNAPAPSQVGSDNGNGATDLNAEWEALTGKGGKFHDLLGQRVSSAIQDRFKNQQDLQGQVDQIADDLSPLFLNYGLDAGDFEGLKNAMASDDSWITASAERAGLTPEQYRHQLQLEADAARGRQIQESYQHEQEMRQRYQQAEAEAAELRQVFPNFDLGMELDHNEEFGRLLANGIDVKTAFLSTHYNDIFNGVTQNAQQNAMQNIVATMRQRSARPAESAATFSPAIERRSDPSKYTKEDFDRIDEIVMNGGSVII